MRTSDAAPERRLAAILAAGIDGYALLARGDGSQRRAEQELDLLRAAIAQASGTIFSFGGDGVMAEFPSATEALLCALAVQSGSGRRMGRSAAPVRFRMAVTAGEILAGKRHIGGAPIMLAASLERIAPAGGIALPGSLHEQIRVAVAVPVEPMGQPELADPAGPVVVVGISPETCLAWSGGVRPVPQQPGRAAGDPRVGVAVVPFGAGGAHAAFAEKATDEAIRTLGGLATWLSVSRAPGASIASPIDLNRLRRTSRACYVLHGSVEAERGMLRLTAELNEAESGRVLWSDRFDHPLGQQAALREDAAMRIASAVPPVLLGRELDRSALAPPESLTAHDLALRAFSAIMRPERDTFAAAGGMLRQSERRPGSGASTRFALVWWHLMAIGQGWTSDPAAELRSAAGTAARLDRNDPAAMALIAFMESALRGDHGVAGTMLDRVIDAAPFCGLAESLNGLVLAYRGCGERAVLHAERGERLPGLGPERAWQEQVVALTHYLAADYAGAEQWARISAVHHPGLAANARILAASLAVLGRLDEAQQAAEQVLAIDPDFRIGAWRQRSLLPEESRHAMAQRLRLAGLPA